MKSSSKAPNMMLVVMMNRLVTTNDALDGPKLLHVARKSDGAGVIEPVLLLGFLQQLHEEWMVDVNHRNHEFLLLLTFMTHHDR